MAVLLAAPALAEDARWRFPQQYSVSPKGVNLQTGRFIYSKVDVSIGSMQFKRNWGDVPAMTFTGRSLGILRLYSQTPVLGFVSPNTGWSHNFNSGVMLANMENGVAQISVVVDEKLYSFAQLIDQSVIPAGQTSSGMTLAWANGQWTLTDRSGATFVFYKHPALTQPDSLGSNQVLQSATAADGTRVDYGYDSAARPIFMKDNRGYAIALEYDGNGNVSAACGYNLAVTYADASTGCSGASLKTTYGYDSSGAKLVSVTDILSSTLTRVVTMSYVTSPGNFSWLTCITKPNSSTCDITNAYGQADGAYFNYADQVNTQTTAEGKVWKYTFRGPEDPQDVPPNGLPRWSRASMTDPENRIYSFKYDRGRLTEQYAPGSIVTQYRYPYQEFLLNLNGSGVPTSIAYHDASPRLVEFPEGNREYIAHDNRGNIVAHSYWPKGSPNPAEQSNIYLRDCCIAIGTPSWPAGSVTFIRTFLPDAGAITTYGMVLVLGCASGPPDAKLCDKPLTSTDAKGNTTDYTYDPAHGGVLTETAPAVNGVRAQTRYTYAQRYAGIKTAGGSFVPADTPVWVLTQKSICKMGAASGAGCATASDEDRTLYEYGPTTGANNLLLRGVVTNATVRAMRTCYSYDAQGNRISETPPRALLSSCP